uniref:G-protein coupled receptors family 1 profile domain-containing protein n=1 Tax=Plectus sambesii TaxID=2011161 RepID=A0A914W659_9BILA
MVSDSQISARTFVDHVVINQWINNLEHGIDFENDSCLNTISRDEIKTFVQQYNSTPALYYDLFIAVPFPLAFLGFLLNFLFICHAIRGLQARQLPKRLYLFLINRSIGDALAAFTSTLISIYGFSCGRVIPNAGVISFSDTIFWITYWAAVVCYIGLSGMKLLAVSRPLQYMKLVTTKKCVYLIASSWVIAFIAGAFISAAMISLAEDGGWCDYETCGSILVQICAVFETICYIAVLACFAATFAYIRKAHHSQIRNTTKITTVQNLAQNSAKHTKTIRTPNNWRLSVGVIAFGIFYCLPTFVGLFVAFVFSDCYFTIHWHSSLVLSGSMRIVMLLRICIDPVINFWTDPNLRRFSLLPCKTANRSSRLDSYSSSNRSIISTNSSTIIDEC